MSCRECVVKEDGEEVISIISKSIDTIKVEYAKTLDEQYKHIIRDLNKLLLTTYKIYNL